MGSRPGAAENVSDANDWSDCVSSSRGAAAGAGAARLAGSVVVVETLALRAMRAAFFCCSSWVRDSTGSARTMFSVASGSRASTV